MQFSPLPCYLVPLRPKYSPQYLFSNTHSLCSSLKVSDQVSHPYKTTLNILIFVFLNNRRGQKILRRICDYIFKLLIITESQLDRIALQSRILYVAEWITVCEANFPCRRFCTPPHDVQSNVYCRTPAVTPSDLLSHFTVQYRFKNRRSYKSFTLGDVVINLSQTKCLHFEFINTFAASYLNTQGLNNSCLKSPASTLVDLIFQSRALRSFSLNQLCNLSL